MMPALKYYDPGSSTYKYVTGGMSQAAADARYLGSGFRNVIRNGDMSIFQRGVGPFTTSGYTVDGWRSTLQGGTFTVNWLAATVGFPSPKVSLVTSGQAAASDFSTLSSRVENVNTLNGEQVTVSFDAWASTAGMKIGVEAEQFFGTGGSPAATQNTPAGSVTLTNYRLRYSLTFTIPSTYGLTIGTNNDNYLRLVMWLSAGSNFNTRASNIGIQNGTIYLTDVQLEDGPVGTPFERLPQQQQLAWCQRYFQRIGNNNPNQATRDNQPLGEGVLEATNKAYIFIHHAVQMRAAPTGSIPVPGNLGVWQGSAQATVNQLFGIFTDALITTVEPGTSAAVGTAGQSCIMQRLGAADGYIDISAEL